MITDCNIELLKQKLIDEMDHMIKMGIDAANKETHKDRYLSKEQIESFDKLVYEWIPKLEAMFRDNTLNIENEEMKKCIIDNLKHSTGEDEE